MPSSACKTCALRSEEHTSELQSHDNLECRLLLEKKKTSALCAADRHRPVTPYSSQATGDRPAAASPSPAASSQSCHPPNRCYLFFFFFLIIGRPPRFTLFPYTPLFR